MGILQRRAGQVHTFFWRELEVAEMDGVDEVDEEDCDCENGGRSH
jgi:hypothetical protein